MHLTSLSQTHAFIEGNYIFENLNGPPFLQSIVFPHHLLLFFQSSSEQLYQLVFSFYSLEVRSSPVLFAQDILFVSLSHELKYATRTSSPTTHSDRATKSPIPHRNSFHYRTTHHRFSFSCPIPSALCHQTMREGIHVPLHSRN